ncbi:MAG: alpha/beta fold hydrolase [Candidatus Limnocylindria bacterium]
MALPLDLVPAADRTARPAGFTVASDDGDRLHFLDWDGPTGAIGVVAIHGLSNTAWSWSPVARRVRGATRFVAMDLRGHGLSDAPTDPEAYALDVLGGDVVAVAEGSGLLEPGSPVVLAGHGFGAMVALAAALRLDDRCAGVVLVDGGWESMEAALDVDADEFLRGIEEPPEVMRSLRAFLADRVAFDPASWDDDQDQAARAQVVETHAGRVVPATRPHALEASVRAMFRYDPEPLLAGVAAPVLALRASSDDPRTRVAALGHASALREAAGLPPIATFAFEGDGHNLMRYRPAEVSAAILALVAGRWSSSHAEES